MGNSLSLPGKNPVFINKSKYVYQKKLNIIVTFSKKISISHYLALKQLRIYILVYHNLPLLPSDMGEMNQWLILMRSWFTYFDI